jgi:hypothetical protein
MPLLGAPLFVSESYKPLNLLVFLSGTAKYDDLSRVHTLASRSLYWQLALFTVNFKHFFAAVVYMTLFHI